MAKIPITEAVSRVLNGDGSATVTATWTDADGTTIMSVTHTFPATVLPLSAVASLRKQAHEVIAGYLTWADLPPSFSVQIGLDTSLRELDLL